MREFAGRRIHFVGVGGASMRALAEFCVEEDAKVSGSDKSPDGLPARLAETGAQVYVGSRTDIISAADVVVYSSAVPFDDPELSAARAKGIPVVERQDFLAEIAGTFDVVAAVAGTHGKTTVTAMIAHVLKTCGIPFVAHIGGEPYGMSNLTVNRGTDGKIPHTLFLTEACEYKRNLLALKPSLAVVTNMECDHPDCYANLNEVHSVFAKFVEKCPLTVLREDDEFVCTNEHICIRKYPRYEKPEKDDERATRNTDPQSVRNSSDGEDEPSYARKRICTYGVSRILECAEGQTIELACPDGRARSICLSQCGEHMATDAALAVVAVCGLGVNADDACAALLSFRGVKRRYEKAGKISGAYAVFDYAHHPTEIECTLRVAEKEGRLLVVFQPHTYSRTARYMGDFVRVLSQCDELVIMPTYAARECGSDGATERELADAIAKEFPKNNVYLAVSHDDAWNYVKKHASDFDVVLFLGAGDIYALKDRIVPAVR